MNSNIKWSLYCRSGNIEIWHGQSTREKWETWEVRNVRTGDTIPTTKLGAKADFASMLETETAAKP